MLVTVVSYMNSVFHFFICFGKFPVSDLSCLMMKKCIYLTTLINYFFLGVVNIQCVTVEGF